MERKLVICMVLFLAGIATFNFTYSLMDEKTAPLPQAEEILKPNPIQEEIKIMEPIYIDINEDSSNDSQLIEEKGYISNLEAPIQKIFE